MFMPRFLNISLAVGLTMPLLSMVNGSARAGPVADLVDQLEGLSTDVDSLQEDVGLILGSMMVPFRTTISGGLCDSSGNGSTSNPEIDISGELSGATFVVNSILIQTESFTEMSRIFSVNSVTVDGAFFKTNTRRLFNTYSNDQPGAGFVAPGFDLMGLRLKESAGGGSVDEGGVFPSHIVATSNEGPDINVRLFCRSDDTDWNIARISVSGMKQVDDVITVSYTPGS